MVVAVGAVGAQLAAGLDVVAAAIERQRVHHVDRARAADHRQVRIVAERFVARDDQRRDSRDRPSASAGPVIPSAVNPLVPELCGRFSRRRALTPTRSSLNDPRRERLGEPGAEIVPLVEDGDAEAREVAPADGKRRVARVAAEAVAERQRAAVPDGVIGLDRELPRRPVAQRRRDQVGLRIRAIGRRIQRAPPPRRPR